MFTWRKATLVFLTVLVLETSVLIHVYFNAVFLSTKDVINAVSRETLLLFNSYDTNGDGAIDLWEFEAIKQWISETNLQTGHEDIWMSDNDIDINFENLKATTGEILDIKADFTPLVLNSMTKFKDEEAFQEDLKTLTGLRIWQIALKKQAAFAVEAFNIFLPKRKNMDVGEAWTFVAPNMSQYEPALSGNRFIPLAVNTDHVTLHYLLQMFHPRPFLYSRFPPQGAVACIRAENEKFLEIEFRLHAEFQLNKPPLLPLWFTPAQFSGRLIITKDGNHIEHFEMEVPNNQTLNVDMEWLTGGTKSDEVVIDGESGQKNNQNNMEVDIGYLPKMKLTGIAPSYHQKDNAFLTSVVQEIKWEREIPHEEARMILEQKMYPFKKVPYLSFDQAYTKAKEEKKLVHSILLWGALDDQSC